MFFFLFFVSKKLTDEITQKETNIGERWWLFLEMEKFLNETVWPIDIEWKLNKEDLMKLMNVQDGCLNSEHFSANNISGLQYYLQIFPDGFDEDSLGQTYMFFNIDGLEERKVTAEFVIFVESAIFFRTYDCVFEDEMKHEMDICGTSEFFDPQMRYFVDGKITIVVKGRLKTKHPSTPETVCPIDTEWKFKKADLMDLMESENKSLNGKYFYAFNIPGLRYRIEIYPNGDNVEHRGETWMFVYTKVFKKRKVIPDIKIIIESANVSKDLKYIHKEETGWGNTICKMDEFFDSKSKFFLDGEITIKVKGILKTSICTKSIIANSISMQWKIKEANLKEIMEEEKNKKCLCSDAKKVASFSDVSYYLEIYPNNINDENESGTFIYLHVDLQNNEQFAAVFDLSIKTANCNTSFQVCSNASIRVGTFLCSTKDLFDPSKGFIVNGYLIVNFNGILVKEKNHSIKLKCKNGVSLKSVFEMDVKDYLIVVGEKEIQVHKKVLMEASPVFTGMLESELKESITENKMYITNFTFTIVDAAIKLCYGINVSLKYSVENLLSLFKFGHEYRIAIIMDLTEEYLIKEMSPSNVVYLFKFSALDSFNVKKLHQKCIECFIKCSKESTPVYASESLGETFLAAMVLNTFSSQC